MCGIAGILRFDDEPIDERRLAAMLAHLRHRGPDGQGVSVRGRCALLHTRLSIIDVLGGEQPMHVPHSGENGPLSLSFNGEIYNHRELRQQLEKLGHIFVSDHCDTEVLLHGYRQWGEELPKRLHGMWAFAIWNAEDHSLFLCRDRAGKKPLYLRWSTASDGRRELMFASLVATLRHGEASSPRSLVVEPQALRTYLLYGYNFEPSLLPGVTELPAAHWMRIDAQGSTESQRYWRPPPISRSSTALGAVQATLELLTESVASRLEADVPLGCFLSGGIDSSLIAAIAQRQLTQRGQGPLRTFNVAMPDLNYDESPHAEAVAKHLGTEHIRLECRGQGDVMADLERLVAVSGEPLADSSILPTYWLSRAVREHVKVALSGDGGDELFGGYDRYRALMLLARHRWWLSRLPQAALMAPAGVRPHSRRTRLRRLAQASQPSSPRDQYQRMIRIFAPAQLAELCPALPLDPREELPDWPEEHDPVHAAMRWDLTHYLPFDLLRKVDRAAMAVALEVRCPMLDRQVCDLAGHLPSSVLMPGGKPKALLRKVAAQFLSASTIARKKRGFALPIGRWFTTGLAQPLRQRLLDGRLESMGFNPPAIETLWREHVEARDDHTHRLFSLLTLSIWRAWAQETALS